MRSSTARFVFLLLALSTLGWTASTSPADEKSSIAAVAQNYMDAYYTANPARMKAVLHPGFHKRTLHVVNGQIEITEDTVRSMVEGVRGGSGTKVPANERVQKIEVLDVYKMLPVSKS